MKISDENLAHHHITLRARFLIHNSGMRMARM